MTFMAKGGYVLVALVCPSICLSVSEQHYQKSYERIVMKFHGGVMGCTMKY